MMKRIIEALPIAAHRQEKVEFWHYFIERRLHFYQLGLKK
jgi:hypothetical protein